MSGEKTRRSYSPVNELLRNKYRVLNHLPLIRRKLAVGRRWQLVDDVDNAAPRHRRVQGVLEGLWKREILIEESLNAVAAIAGRSADQLEYDLRIAYPTGLLELHPTDACNLDCVDCCYEGDSATIPFDTIASLVTALHPAAITVTGGGEPTVYSNQGNGIHELTRILRNAAPTARLGMINNNVVLPAGGWPNHYSWQRTSIDAASAQVYERIKRRASFDKVVANTKHLLLRSRIRDVGIGFLYRQENVDEIAEFLLSWYRWYSTVPASAQDRFNIQFRPISPPIEDADRVLHGNLVFQGDDFATRLRDQIAVVRRCEQADSSFKVFLARRTNFCTLEDWEVRMLPPLTHRPAPFGKCFNGLIHRVLRATGDEYPDFLLCGFPYQSLGNRLCGAERELLRVSLLQYYYFNCGSPFCNAESCRQGWVSQICEQHIAQHDFADVRGRIPRDYFF